MTFMLIVLTCFFYAPECQTKPSPSPGALSDPSPGALPDPIPFPFPAPRPLPSPHAMALPGKFKAAEIFFKYPVEASQI